MSGILIAYFSHKGMNYFGGKIVELTKGNAEIIAETVKACTGGDLFEIKTEKSYPFDYYECTKLAQEELRENERPVLKENIDITPYKTIILVYPNWWNTVPMAIKTFLESGDFSDKKIAPIATHEGSGLGSSEKDIKIICPDSELLCGLAIKGTDSKSCKGYIEGYLKAVKII